jgi:hypothetical protein
MIINLILIGLLAALGIWLVFKTLGAALKFTVFAAVLVGIYYLIQHLL